MSRREHVLKLAAEAGVTIEFRKRPDFDWGQPATGGEYWPSRHHIDVWGIDFRNEYAYFVVLHELGHAHDRVPQRSIFTADDTVLREEASAWMFALRNALKPPSPRTVERIFGEESFGSYLRDLEGGYDLPEVQEVIGSYRQRGENE